MTHFHLLHGMTGGYLPNGNDYYPDEESAKSGLVALADRFDEEEHERSGGDDLIHRYRYHTCPDQVQWQSESPTDLGYYAEIVECENAECKDDDN